MALELDVTAIEQALLEFAKRSEEAITELCEDGALVMENYAKAHRPWTDRTGQARQRLKGTVEHPERDQWQIVLSHGVDYGIWLEYAHERKYAIIDPTIKMNTPEVMEAFEGLVSKLWSNL